MKYLLILLLLVSCSKSDCVKSLLYQNQYNNDPVRTDVTVEQAIKVCE